MKIKTTLCVTVCAFLIASCSKLEEALDDTESKTEQVLAEESPWVFSTYEISTLEDDGGSGLSPQEIENDMNQYMIGVSFSFNNDGTGFYDLPEDGIEDYTWSLKDGRLTTVTDTQTDVYAMVTVMPSELRFQSKIITVHIRDSVRYNVTHRGNYLFE